MPADPNQMASANHNVRLCNHRASRRGEAVSQSAAIKAFTTSTILLFEVAESVEPILKFVRINLDRNK